MKTVKQIADEIGVSKQAVHQKRKKPPLSTALQPFTETVDGVVYISVDGEILIKQAFAEIDRQQVDGSFTPVDGSFTTTVDGSFTPPFTPVDITLREIIETLNQQLAVKDRQIENKDKQIADQQQSIKELTAALENTTSSLMAAQALHAGTMKQQIESLPPIGAEQARTDTATEKKESFFARLFKK